MRVLNGGLQVTLWQGGPGVGPGGDRGVISGMSSQSRKRFRLALMSIDWTRYQTMWVTLTYHNEWPIGSQGWKRDLDAFERRLRRAWGDRGWRFATWRLERQRRGAPHYHLIVAFEQGRGPSAGAFRRWATQAWLEIVGGWGSDWAAEAYGVHVDHVVSVDRYDRPQLGGILGYLVSEHCKVDQNAWEGQATGRVWGLWGGVEFAEVQVVELDELGLGVLLERLHARGGEVGSWYLRNLSANWPGFFVLGDGRDLVDTLLAGVPHQVLCRSG